MTRNVATSRYVGSNVRGALRSSVPYASDGWLIGPCALDPDVQMRLRTEFWCSFTSFEDRFDQRAWFVAAFRRVQEALAADESVILWGSPIYEDRVAIWALCYYRLLYRPTDPKLSLILVGEIVPADPPRLFDEGYVRINTALVRHAQKTAQPLSLSEVSEKAQFWEKLTMPSPILSGEALCETPSSKELLAMGTYQAGFFPRRTARGLALSTVDAALLGSASDIPSTPATVLVGKDEDGEVFKWIDLTGDVIFFERLKEWAKFGALHAEPHTTPNGVQTALYTITPLGQSLLRDGLTSIAQAPPLPIWGVTAYDRNNPWVVVEEAGKGMHLRRPA